MPHSNPRHGYIGGRHPRASSSRAVVHHHLLHPMGHTGCRSYAVEDCRGVEPRLNYQSTGRLSRPQGLRCPRRRVHPQRRTLLAGALSPALSGIENSCRLWIVTRRSPATNRRYTDLQQDAPSWLHLSPSFPGFFGRVAPALARETGLAPFLHRYSFWLPSTVTRRSTRAMVGRFGPAGLLQPTMCIRHDSIILECSGRYLSQKSGELGKLY